VRAAAADAIIQAMDKVYALVIATGALAFVSSLFMKREKLFIKAVASGDGNVPCHANLSPAAVENSSPTRSANQAPLL
jgi:hypothetical protein